MRRLLISNSDRQTKRQKTDQSNNDNTKIDEKVAMEEVRIKIPLLTVNLDDLPRLFQTSVSSASAPAGDNNAKEDPEKWVPKHLRKKALAEEIKRKRSTFQSRVRAPKLTLL